MNTLRRVIYTPCQHSLLIPLETQPISRHPLLSSPIVCSLPETLARVPGLLDMNGCMNGRVIPSQFAGKEACELYSDDYCLGTLSGYFKPGVNVRDVPSSSSSSSIMEEIRPASPLTMAASSSSSSFSSSSSAAASQPSSSSYSRHEHQPLIPIRHVAILPPRSMKCAHDPIRQVVFATPLICNICHLHYPS